MGGGGGGGGGGRGADPWTLPVGSATQGDAFCFSFTP